jgi:phosphoesterase RecJ-like protein
MQEQISIQAAAEIGNLLSKPKDILITSHRNPDGDAIGSSLGLYHYLIQLGHSVKVAFPSEYPAIFAWMPDADKILIFDIEPEATREAIESAEIIFLLDFNSLDRIDKMGELIYARQDEPFVAMIDHHLYPDSYPDYALSDTTASSTSELVLDFIELVGGNTYLNRTIGDCLYTGIVTDTGSFRYSTSPKLFRTVARLLELGIDDYRLQDLIHNQQQERQLRILGYCLYHRMIILDDYRTAIISLSKQDYEKFNIQRGDTEGIVNFALTMKNIRLTFFVTEQPNIVKLSIRSKGNFDVQEIARTYFKGGGHKNAAGGMSNQNLEETISSIKEFLPSYRRRLWQLR